MDDGEKRTYSVETIFGNTASDIVIGLEWVLMVIKCQRLASAERIDGYLDT